MKTIKKFEIRSERVQVSENPEIYQTPISSPDVVSHFAKQLTKGLDEEIFITFLLDIKNKVLGYVEVARGGFDACPVDPRIVFRAAIHLGASGVIVLHNHPSGDPKPSIEDDALTQRLASCSKILGVSLLDHLIIGDSVFSYRATTPHYLET